MGQSPSRRLPQDDTTPSSLEVTGSFLAPESSSSPRPRTPSTPTSLIPANLFSTGQRMSTPPPAAAPAAGAAASPASGASTPAAAAQRQVQQHRSTALIPGWSKPLSSSSLVIECQKIAQPSRTASSKECLGVMDVEVMKYVAYCGGLIIRLKVEESQFASSDGLTWGLASLRPCPQLASMASSLVTQGAERSSSRSPTRNMASIASTSCTPSCRPVVNQSMATDNSSRRPLYSMISASSGRAVQAGDVLSLELTPKEDGQPVIVATLSLNDAVVLQASLPCSAIAALQMYPYVTVNQGITVALNEASTPSPLFTWYSPTSSTADIQLADLDTCVKYNSSTTTTPPAGISEFHGSTTFTSGRHRWTVQLDNTGNLPSHIFVGLVNAEPSTTTPSNVLSNIAQPLRISGSGASASTSNGGAPESATASITPPRPTQRWGVWVKLPGVIAASSLPYSLAGPVPPREGVVQMVESTSSHCCITVDLDLNHSYAKFFRNGHLLGSAFTNITGPICPALSFLQGTNQHCQAGLVNITKLKQLDLEWNANACSGDLRLNGNKTITKISEVYGDYSTVLANHGFISGVHLWLMKIVNLSEPDSIFLGVCRGCMPLDQDPQDLRDRTYYLSNGVIRVGGRRVATNAANFTRGDTVGVVLDADQGEIVFLRNGVEQGRARGIRGRLYPFVSFDSEGDQITLIGAYTLNLNRTPRQLADMEWDTLGHAADLDLSSNCLTATKTQSNGPSTVRGTILYAGTGVHEFHVIMDTLGPDGISVGVAPPDVDPTKSIGDPGCGWALHSDGDRRYDGKEEEYTTAFKNGDVLTVSVDLGRGTLRFARNGQSLGEAFSNISGPVLAVVTLLSEDSKATIQNRPTVLNTGEYTGELRWDEVRAGRDLHVIDGLTVTKMSNDGGDYATVLGTLCLASGQHSWNVYINHVEDSNLFIGVTIGGHDLNADPQEMKHRTYYLSNGTIRVAGKLVTRCAEPYAEGDLVTVQLDMELKHIAFLKNGVLQGTGDGLPEEVWPYISLDNIMDSITLHSSSMFSDLAHSLRWNTAKASKYTQISADGLVAGLKPSAELDAFLGQATMLGLREYNRNETHSWVIRLEQLDSSPPANFLVGVAPPSMDLSHSLGEEGCGIGLDYYGYIYISGRYFHVSSISNWQAVAKPVRGSTARHKGKAGPLFPFHDSRCEITITLDLKEGTLKFSSAGHHIGTLAGIKGPVHPAVTLTSTSQTATLAPGPIGKNENTAEELVNVLKAKAVLSSPRLEAALLLVARDIFVPKDRQREAFRDQKVSVRLNDGSTLSLPPPSFVCQALERLGLQPGERVLDVGCGSAYVSVLAACMVGETGGVTGIECVPSRLEAARNNLRLLKERLPVEHINRKQLGDVMQAFCRVELALSNVLIPECAQGATFDAIYCDTSLSEEDVPAFLSLLKPHGRMVVIIEDELLLITRSPTNAADFHREPITKVMGDYGNLEDPTPWEVQEAIQRIKAREHAAGMRQAKADIIGLRSYELAEMQMRCATAMQRVGELEAQLAASQRADGRPPRRSASQLPAGVDDVRVIIRDKSRRTPRASPRNGSKSQVPDNAEWRSLYSAETVKNKVRQLMGDEAVAAPACTAGDDLKEPAAGGHHAAAYHQSLEDAIDGLGVPLLSVHQVRELVSEVMPDTSSGYHAYSSSYKGVPARIWRMPLAQHMSYLELKRMYSRFAVAHPNISAILAACIQPGSDPVAAAAADTASAADAADAGFLWLVEECFSGDTLQSRLERGLLSWQQVLQVATDMARAVAYLQSLRKLHSSGSSGSLEADSIASSVCGSTCLSHAAAASLVNPVNVLVSGTQAKLCLVPAMLSHIGAAYGCSSSSSQSAESSTHAMAYVDMLRMVGGSGSFNAGAQQQPLDCFYAYGVVVLQLLAEQAPMGLIGAVREALHAGTLQNLVPRLPVSEEAARFAEQLAALALRCVQLPGTSEAPESMEADVLPALAALQQQLPQLGSSSMSWEQVEELLMLPLQPRPTSDSAGRRWVRHDFRARKKAFLEEVAKLAVEGPIHKIEVRRSRCFKDSVATFAGKGQNVWRQPLKVTFVGEAGMDSGGVTREWFSSLSSALSRGSLDLFWKVGAQRSSLYINPMSNSPSHLKRFHFVGLFMAKALLETAARTKELGPISLNLRFCEPFWKLLLGIPLSMVDLHSLDPTEFRSIMQVLGMDIEGVIFETFTWNFEHASKAAGKDEPEVPALPSTSSPFTADQHQLVVTSIPLKPGGAHVNVTNANKREYVLLKTYKMLCSSVEAQMTAIIDAFHTLVPRELIEKYSFTPQELQLLVCGEQHIDIADLKAHCKYEDGYTGKEDQIQWLWQALDTFDDSQLRALLQFWSGSDGMPAEGFGNIDPAFHIVAVDRMYDRNDKTARLPAAHTCFRQLDLPRYRSYDELLEKLLTAITMGQGYMALS